MAFATILAVVSGLTLAGASAISHDLYATVIKNGQANEQDEIRVSKIATVVLGIIAVVLGIVFEKQNVAFMVGLAFSIAASCNFPVLLMSMMWKGMTTRGAVYRRLPRPDLRADRRDLLAGGVGSDARQSEGLGAVPDRQPGAVLDVARLLRHLAVLEARPQQARPAGPGGFDAQYVRSQTGIGASGASAH